MTSGFKAALLGATITAGAVAPALANDWPMAGGAIDNNRHAADESTLATDSVAGLAPIARLTTNGNNWATPVVAEGRAFFPDSGGILWAIDAGNGEVIWQRPLSDYNGVANSASRVSAVYHDGTLFVGDRGGANLTAIDPATGEMRWITDLEEHANAQVTGSPIAHEGRVYIGVSSAGAYQEVDGELRSTFRGSLVVVDATSGEVLWRHHPLPENHGADDSWSGGAVISSPAIDPDRGVVYYHGDHYYSQPADVLACLTAAKDDWDPACYPGDALANALIALDLETGTPQWSFLGSGSEAYRLACGEVPSISWQIPVTNNRMCPPLGDWVNWGFAVGSPNLFAATIDGAERDLIGLAQKSGFYWALDAENGEVVWVTWVGPFSEPGGLAQGAAYDGERLYISVANFENTPHFTDFAPCPDGICSGSDPATLGTPIWGGSWAALDPATGERLWQVGAPGNARVYGSPVVANGVLFVGSMAAQGDNMFALDAETGDILWRFAAEGSVTSNPSVVDGRVYWGAGFGLFWGVPGKNVYIFGLE